MGQRGYLGSLAAGLAEALYAQDRLDEAQQMAEQAQAAAVADETGPQVEWRATRAKLLARSGHFPAARQLIAEAEALLSPASSPLERATMLEDKAEIDRLAGAPDQAAASLRAALRIYEDRRATLLAEQAKAALASLAVGSDIKPV